MVQCQKDSLLRLVFDPKATLAELQKYGLPADTKGLSSYDVLYPDMLDVWVDFTNPTLVALYIEALM